MHLFFFKIEKGVLIQILSFFYNDFEGSTWGILGL
jgi:hypothetical protein